MLLEKQEACRAPPCTLLKPARLAGPVAFRVKGDLVNEFCEMLCKSKDPKAGACMETGGSGPGAGLAPGEVGGWGSVGVWC